LLHKLNEEVTPRIVTAKETVAERYGIPDIKGCDLVCQKLYELQYMADYASYVECGVFKGNTFLTIAAFLEQEGITFPMIGHDSFEGFPADTALSFDEPYAFQDLYDSGKITLEHLEKAKEKTNNFTRRDHLETDYFVEVDNVFKKCSDFNNVELVVGDFLETLPQFRGDIAVLFIDCDLYLSYLYCLQVLYQHVVPGGVIVFDEYYSLKYPGPRLAVDTFFLPLEGEFECYKTEGEFDHEGYERWCFVKESV